MSQLDTAIILGGEVLSKYADLTRRYKPNETDVTTLGGNLYTDFRNNRRSWNLSWKLIKREEYDIIESLYLEQYTTGVYQILQFDAFNIYTSVKIQFSDQKIKYNASVIKDFSIILREYTGFS